MPKRFYKHKLLLDENMPPRFRFPRLTSRFDVKHIREDLNHQGLPDPQVYKLAIKLKRVLVTLNEKDFLRLHRSGEDAGIISVSPHLSYEQIDTKLTALLMKNTYNSLKGKFIGLTGEN